jgi:hypothetical protein
MDINIQILMNPNISKKQKIKGLYYRMQKLAVLFPSLCQR